MKFIKLIIISFFITNGIHAQNDTLTIDSLRKDALKIFIDCNYCDEDFIGFDTIVDPYGCSLGATTYANVDESCCPSGMRCNVTTLICSPRVTDCTSFAGDEDRCKDESCDWLSLTNECVDGLSDEDCGYYDGNKLACEGDAAGLDIGSKGIGSKFCNNPDSNIE